MDDGIISNSARESVKFNRPQSQGKTPQELLSLHLSQT